MKNTKRQTLSLAILVLAILVSAQAQEGYRLQYKFQKGSTHHYRALQKNDITQEMQGQEMKTTSTTRTVIRLAVNDVLNDGSMVIVISADSMLAHTKNAMVDTTMVMKNMIGKRMKVTLAATGNIQSREVIDSVKSDTRGSAARSPQREAMSFLHLPDKELKAGETWTDAKTDTVDVGTGKVVNTTDVVFTLVGKEKKQGRECLKITYTGKLSTNGKLKNMGMDIYTEGSGKISGTLYFDHVHGLLVRDDSVRDIESTLAVTGQQNMTIPMSTSTTTSLEFLEN